MPVSFDLPIQKGDGEVFGPVMAAPPNVTMRVIASNRWLDETKDQESVARAIAEKADAQITGMVNQQRQFYALSNIQQWRKGAFVTPQVFVDYNNIGGFEAIELAIYPESTPAPQPVDNPPVPRTRKIELGQVFSVKTGYGADDPNNYVVVYDPKAGNLFQQPTKNGTGFYQGGFFGFGQRIYWEVRVRKLPRLPDPATTTQLGGTANGSYTDTSTYYQDPVIYTKKVTPLLNTFRTPIIGFRPAYGDDNTRFDATDPRQRWSWKELLAENAYGDDYSYSNKATPPVRSIGLLPTSGMTSINHSHTETAGRYTVQPQGSSSETLATYQSIYDGANPPITYPSIVMNTGVYTGQGNDLFQVTYNDAKVSAPSSGPPQGSGNYQGYEFFWPPGTSMRWVKVGTAGGPAVTPGDGAWLTFPPTVRFYPKTPNDSYFNSTEGDNQPASVGYNTTVFKGLSKPSGGGIYAGQDYPISNGYPWLGVRTPTKFGALAEGDIVMIAVDCIGGGVWFGINGTWLNSGDPTKKLNPNTFLDKYGDDLKPPADNPAHRLGYVPAIGFTLKPPQQMWLQIVYDRGSMKYEPPGGFKVADPVTITVPE